MITAIEAFVRRSIGIGNHSVPVYIVDDTHGPVATGESGGWYTRGGRPIRSPGAYARVGWSNMEYRCNDQTVWVGQGWINKQLLRLVRDA